MLFNIVGELVLFLLALFVAVNLSLFLVGCFLKRTPYCVDRVIYVPLFTTYISREHGKTYLEALRDIVTEIICYLPLLVILVFLTYIISLNRDFIIIEALFFVTTVLHIFSTLMVIVIYLFRYLSNPSGYFERTFIDEGRKQEIGTLHHDPFTMEEKYELYNRKTFSTLSVYYLKYFYNLSTTMIDGKIVIKRKIKKFLSSYGLTMVFIPLMIVIFVVTPIQVDTYEDVESPYDVGSTILSRNLFFAVSILYVTIWVSVIVPMQGFLSPEVDIIFEKIVNKHNNNCKCKDTNDNCKRLLSVMVDSYRTIQENMRV